MSLEAQRSKSIRNSVIYSILQAIVHVAAKLKALARTRSEVGAQAR